jgi:uncharacterized protein YbaP (TraB family)
MERAAVPEHSAAFMAAMSGGEPFLTGPYLFLAAAEWLVAVGYPLSGEYTPDGFEEALSAALRRTRARDCWAICPSLPERLRLHCRERDEYYVLEADAPIPARLARQAERAAACLRLEEGRAFTAAHRRLWAEFVGRAALPDNVRELFARTEDVLARVPGLSLLNAWDTEGCLAASFLVDASPARFLSYLIGARPQQQRTPHASDALFLAMIRAARRRGKAFLHLGLGVNGGIRRFKTKWGGRPAMPYEMAAWQEPVRTRSAMAGLMQAVAAAPARASSQGKAAVTAPEQRRFAMLWEVEKHGRRSWIGGTAHFFCFSFESSFRRLFQGVDTVLFEGPLDPASLDRVAEIGKSPASGPPRLDDALGQEAIRRLERVVCGPRGFWARVLGIEWHRAPDVRGLLRDARPWMAFFAIWSGYLARKGWQLSVDLEARGVALDMGKAVAAMETIEEQIETLEAIPVQRIVDFFRRCRQWDDYTRRNLRAYLRGDLTAMLGTSTEFPTRTEAVIGRRDALFLERMKPFLQEGRCAVFVGAAHLLNLRPMLQEAGFRVSRCG